MLLLTVGLPQNLYPFPPIFKLGSLAETSGQLFIETRRSPYAKMQCHPKRAMQFSYLSWRKLFSKYTKNHSDIFTWFVCIVGECQTAYSFCWKNPLCEPSVHWNCYIMRWRSIFSDTRSGRNKMEQLWYGS